MRDPLAPPHVRTIAGDSRVSMDRHERGWSCLERVSAGGAAREVRQGRAFRAVPHEGCFCDCCCSNSSALRECVGQSTKLEAGSAGHADTKSCLGSPPLVQFSMTRGGHRERSPPLLRVSGCWKMLLTAPVSSVGSQLPAAPQGQCQPSHRADPLPCHPAWERKKTPSAKRHRSVPAGKAAGDQPTRAGMPRGEHPAPDGVSLWGAQLQLVPGELAPGLAPCQAFACVWVLILQEFQQREGWYNLNEGFKGRPVLGGGSGHNWLNIRWVAEETVPAVGSTANTNLLIAFQSLQGLKINQRIN